MKDDVPEHGKDLFRKNTDSDMTPKPQNYHTEGFEIYHRDGSWRTDAGHVEETFTHDRRKKYERETQAKHIALLDDQFRFKNLAAGEKKKKK